MRNRTKVDRAPEWLASVAALALVLAGAAVANGQVCGNGILEAGEECEPVSTERCTNFADDDADGLADCQDPDCTVEGTGTLHRCGPDCYAVPVCGHLLDDPAKIKFKMPKKLDFMMMHARTVPDQELDLMYNPMSFLMRNNYGTIYRSPVIYGYDMKYNKQQTRFTYKQKRDGTPKITLFKVRSRPDWYTGKTEYYFKIRIDADLQAANPENPNNEGLTVADLAPMYTQFVVGEAPFYIYANWQTKNFGWYLSDKMMSTWY